LIPTQYKLSFLHDLDLGIVVVNLRNLAEKQSDVDLPLRIMGQLRHMNNLFLQFDRIVVNEMRNRVMEYQKRSSDLNGNDHLPDLLQPYHTLLEVGQTGDRFGLCRLNKPCWMVRLSNLSKNSKRSTEFQTLITIFNRF
jgi:hypothetical protein